MKTWLWNSVAIYRQIFLLTQGLWRIPVSSTNINTSCHRVRHISPRLREGRNVSSSPRHCRRYCSRRSQTWALDQQVPQSQGGQTVIIIRMKAQCVKCVCQVLRRVSTVSLRRYLVHYLVCKDPVKGNRMTTSSSQ